MFDLPPNHRTRVLEEHLFAKQFIVDRRSQSDDVGATYIERRDSDQKKLPDVGVYYGVSPNRSNVMLRSTS